jgi:hypothetical protein
MKNDHLWLLTILKYIFMWQLCIFWFEHLLTVLNTTSFMNIFPPVLGIKLRAMHN